MKTNQINVAIADDDETLCRSLADALESNGIKITGIAENGAVLVDLCRKYAPDIALIDIRMPVMDGVSAVKILREELPDVKVLILTTYDDAEYLRDLLSLGVDGYMLKGSDDITLAAAVRNVCSGAGVMDKNVIRKVGGLIPPEAENIPLSLTEESAALLLLEGKYNKDIAVQLGISYNYARNLISNIYKKTGAAERSDLIEKLRRRLEK